MRLSTVLFLPMTLMKTILAFIVSAACFTSLFAQENIGNSSEPISGDVMVQVGDPGNNPYLRKAKSTEIDPNESNGDRLPNDSRVEEDNPIEITRDTLFERTGIIPVAESALKLPVGAIEIPKQLLVGGIAGLAIGAGCEISGKYLGEGIG